MSIFDEILNVTDANYIGGLVPELKALYITQLSKNNDKNVLVVANSIYEANRMYTAISNFTNNVLFFPMDDY